MLDYRIVERAPFTIVGFKRRFNAETSYQEIPKFWNEWTADRKGLKGMFGICLDMDGKDFDYWIADLYAPWADIPEGCETYQIPGSLWAEFVCRGPLPESLQSVNTKIWSEWLPSLQGYSLAGIAAGVLPCGQLFHRSLYASRRKTGGYGQLYLRPS